MGEQASGNAGRRGGRGWVPRSPIERCRPAGSGYQSWTTAAAAVLIAIVLVAGALPREAAVAYRQASPEPDTARRVACLVPDPGAGAPLTDGTEAGRPVAAATAAALDPALLALQADLELLVHAMAGCLSAGQHRTVAQLATGRYLGVLAGTGGVLNAETYVALAQDLPTVPVTIRAIGDVQLAVDGASADVVYVVANQLVHGRWAFVREPQPAGQPVSTRPAATPEAVAARWLIDGETPLPVEPPPGATRLEVDLDEYEIDPARPQVDENAAGLLLAARNRGEREHELLVLRLEGAAGSEELLRQPGPRLPAGFVFAGQVTVPAGETAELVLVDLAPGRYALVSLLPDENGVPDLAQGMDAELRVG